MQVVLPISAYSFFVNKPDCFQEDSNLIFFIDVRLKSTFINSMFIA